MHTLRAVSSRRQAETFSLPTQFRELRAWAEAKGYEVVEEVADSGGSGERHIRGAARPLPGAGAAGGDSFEGVAGGYRDIRKGDGLHMQPITQATAHGNNVVVVYADRVELRSGWQGQHVEALSIREVSAVRVRGMINCTLIIVDNAGRQHDLERMALPDARAVKAAIERQKLKAGLYD